MSKLRSNISDHDTTKRFKLRSKPSFTRRTSPPRSTRSPTPSAWKKRKPAPRSIFSLPPIKRRIAASKCAKSPAAGSFTPSRSITTSFANSSRVCSRRCASPCPRSKLLRSSPTSSPPPCPEINEIRGVNVGGVIKTLARKTPDHHRRAQGGDRAADSLSHFEAIHDALRPFRSRRAAEPQGIRAAGARPLSAMTPASPPASRKFHQSPPKPPLEASPMIRSKLTSQRPRIRPAKTPPVPKIQQASPVTSGPLSHPAAKVPQNTAPSLRNIRVCARLLRR